MKRQPPTSASEMLDNIARADRRQERAYQFALDIAAVSPIVRLMQPALNLADSDAAIDIGKISTHLFETYDADDIDYEDRDIHEHAGYLFGLAVAFTLGRVTPQPPRAAVSRQTRKAHRRTR